MKPASGPASPPSLRHQRSRVSRCRDGRGLALRGGGDSPPLGTSQAKDPAPGHVEAPEPVDPVRPPGSPASGRSGTTPRACTTVESWSEPRSSWSQTMSRALAACSLWCVTARCTATRPPTMCGSTRGAVGPAWWGTARRQGREVIRRVTSPRGSKATSSSSSTPLAARRSHGLPRRRGHSTPAFLSEHVRDSNGFVHVSPAEVVWRSENDSGLQGMSRLDVEAGTSSVVWDIYDPNGPPMPIDVHDTTRITGLYGDGQGGPVSLLIDAAGLDQQRLDNDNYGVEPVGRLSPVEPGWFPWFSTHRSGWTRQGATDPVTGEDVPFFEPQKLPAAFNGAVTDRWRTRSTSPR